MSKKACIIGAGFSGVAAAKVLSERGTAFDWFEMGPHPGGLWRYDNETGRSPAYLSLRTNTSRKRTALPGLPMPSSYLDFPTHAQMLEYLQSYVDHFALRERLTLNAQVQRVRLAADGSYEVTIRRRDRDDLWTESYSAVIVATGHHWMPSTPEFPGSFEGLEMHSHAYRTPDVAEGKRVLVVGVGNSACDIACEIAGVARRTFMSTRRGAHVIPKRLLGRPADQWLSPVSSRLPRPLQRALFHLLIFLTRGPQKRYGFPLPEHGLDAAHPTMSSELLPLVRQGAIIPKPDLLERDGSAVRFVDGSVETIDVVIYATGYVATFPFLDFIEPEDNYLPLFLHVVHPSYPGIYFLGLVQPLGPNPPLSYAQAEWIADLLTGEAALPSREQMEHAIAREDADRRARYVDSRRHRMEVDFFTYLRALQKEREAGRRRVAAEVEQVV